MYIYTYRLSRNTRETIELWSLLPAYKFNSLEDLLLTGQIPRMPGGRKTLWWSSEGSCLWTWHRFRRFWNDPWMEQFHWEISRCCIYVGISGTQNFFSTSSQLQTKDWKQWFCSIQQVYMSSLEWSNIFTWVFPKIGVPIINHPLKNRVFHYFHHPCWGKIHYFWKHPHTTHLYTSQAKLHEPHP